jgi:hypothetical protein
MLETTDQTAQSDAEIVTARDQARAATLKPK